MNLKPSKAITWNPRGQKKWTLAILFLLTFYFLLFFAASYLTPLMADDFNYSTFSQGPKPFLMEIALQLKNHYFDWGGRLWAHFLAALMLYFRSGVHNSFVHAGFNLLAFAGAIAFSYSLLKKLFLENSPSAIEANLSQTSSTAKTDDLPPKHPNQTDSYLLLALVIFFFTIQCKASFQTLFWLTGAANYLWMYTCFAAFLYFFREFLFKDHLQDSSEHEQPIQSTTSSSPIEALGPLTNASPRGAPKPSTSFFKTLALSLLAFLVGFSNENAGFPLLLLIGLLAIRRKVFRRQSASAIFFSVHEWCVTLSLAVGTVLLLIAPGNQVRSLVVYPDGKVDWLSRIGTWWESLLVFLGRPDGLVVLFVTSLIAQRYLGFRWKDSFRNAKMFLSLPFSEQNSRIKTFFIKPPTPAFCFLILSLLMLLAFLGVDGNFYGRKSFNAAWVFNLFLISLLYQKTSPALVPMPESSKPKWTLVLLILAGGKFGADVARIYPFNSLYRAREVEILSQREHPPITTYSIKNIYNLDDLSEHENVWLKHAYEKFLNIPPLKIKPREPVP